MLRTPFNQGWEAAPSAALFESFTGEATPPRGVHLPFDFLRDLPRDEAGSAHTAFFPSATVEYVKRFTLDESRRNDRLFLELDGVYRDAVVYVNDEYAGQHANGYSRFLIPLHPFAKFGGRNEVKVIARTHEDSRWYTGGGIYREVNLLSGALVHIAPDGVTVSTPDVEQDAATISVCTSVTNDAPRTETTEVVTRIIDAHGAEVASTRVPLTVKSGATEMLRQRLYVTNPALWDVDSPNLYTVRTELLSRGTEVDAEATAFGIRSLTVDPTRGLRVNGRPVKLRGACVHHDNGVLGAAAIGRAEERKVELLKAAGFNALRSAHNPMSSAMLRACDRVGMFVIDETFDVWTVSKTAHDYSLRFADWYERDVEALVRKDYNHPSVIMYAIGNEVPETGSGIGAGWSRRIAERIRDLDPTRLITNAVNPLFSVMNELKAMMSQDTMDAANANVNDMMTIMGEITSNLTTSDLVTERTAESIAALDVAGFNYSEKRYALDAELFPHRIMLGTETFPTKIAENWRLVTAMPHVIGDFTWTGWDYLGEVGLGRVNYEPERVAGSAPYPWLTAWTGDIDITGQRRPASFHREIVFGLRTAPYIAVVRPETHTLPQSRSEWSWSDSVASWTWAAEPGTATRVEVYSAAPEVELVLNGRSLGRRPAGSDHDFMASFDDVPWESGELIAIDHDGFSERERCTLRSAGSEVALVVDSDRVAVAADDADLAFLAISLADTDGVVATHRDTAVTVTVTGAGQLAGLGNADPQTQEPFGASTTSTFDGRALAVIRPTGAGTITVEVSAPGLAPQRVHIEAVAA